MRPSPLQHTTAGAFWPCPNETRGNAMNENPAGQSRRSKWPSCRSAETPKVRTEPVGDSTLGRHATASSLPPGLSARSVTSMPIAPRQTPIASPVSTSCTRASHELDIQATRQPCESRHILSLREVVRKESVPAWTEYCSEKRASSGSSTHDPKYALPSGRAPIATTLSTSATASASSPSPAIAESVTHRTPSVRILVAGVADLPLPLDLADWREDEGRSEEVRCRLAWPKEMVPASVALSPTSSGSIVGDDRSRVAVPALGEARPRLPGRVWGDPRRSSMTGQMTSVGSTW
mmetsp:Transcript_1111/g.2178  ORF Transcript_1111/g.2178 Transcript_1111/m.2178 type:complete len:292 (-) Transcript_1111:1366-2241(-)